MNSPPAKFVRDSVGRIGNAIDSVVSLGSVLSGTHLERSVVGPWTLAGGGSTITDSVLFDHVRVGQGARIHRAILDKNTSSSRTARPVGSIAKREHRQGFTVTDSGLTVVGKGIRVDALSRRRADACGVVPPTPARFLVVLDADSTLIATRSSS